MQYANNILDKYESRPRKWWQYTLIALALAALRKKLEEMGYMHADK